ncbi:MAG: 5-(carboxyamino)imidazole ribonucleotide synthase [Phycisphaeraceae bacterium]|nr:5-(carboxyamino)imidazole ribonucleotide synthase [Phycisphaeraceae bacterium]
MSRLIPPGSTLGVLGSGQLGRMFTLAARRMGYRVHVLSPDDDTPTGQVADVEIKAAYDDLDQVADFARGVRVVTFEFENVPASTTEAASRFAPIRPAGSVLQTTQNRLIEKNYLRSIGLPVTDFARVDSLASLNEAVAKLGLPAVLKTSAWGYDGKGQILLRSQEEIPSAWERMAGQECILEAWVDFAGEISVIGARALDGGIETFGPVANVHHRHILDISVCPAPGLGEKVRRRAVEMTRAVLESLEVVGVLCVEMFVTADGELLINELAPRPHNSGHLTIDACDSCQFEQQVRAICGLPLGSTRMRAAAAMANLLGDLWAGPMDYSRALAFPELKLHLYGKAAARPGRKMGHLTALADTPQEAEQIVRQARLALTGSAERSS